MVVEEVDVLILGEVCIRTSNRWIANRDVDVGCGGLSQDVVFGLCCFRETSGLFLEHTFSVTKPTPPFLVYCRCLLVCLSRRSLASARQQAQGVQVSQLPVNYLLHIRLRLLLNSHADAEVGKPPEPPVSLLS